MRKVAIGIKVLPESEDLASSQLELPATVELTQRQKNLNIMRDFSELLFSFMPVKGATPFFNTDIMDLPMTELKEMPSAAHVFFPFVPAAGMSGPLFARVGKRVQCKVKQIYLLESQLHGIACNG